MLALLRMLVLQHMRMSRHVDFALGFGGDSDSGLDGNVTIGTATLRTEK